MRIRLALSCGGALWLAACGGGTEEAPVSGLAFTGTLNVSSALPAGTTTCLATTVVTFGAAGADRRNVTVEGGGCLEFVNADGTARRPGPRGASPCAELDAPTSLATGASFTTAPLGGPRTCLWQDELHPPPAGSGGGDGY